jgi:hypothetical protein
LHHLPSLAQGLPGPRPSSEKAKRGEEDMELNIQNTNMKVYIDTGNQEDLINRIVLDSSCQPVSVPFSWNFGDF